MFWTTSLLAFGGVPEGEVSALMKVDDVDSFQGEEEVENR